VSVEESVARHGRSSSRLDVKPRSRAQHRRGGATDREARLVDPLLRGDRAAADAEAGERSAPLRAEGSPDSRRRRHRPAGGLTLDEIRTLLHATDENGEAMEQLRTIAERKLPEITALIERSELVRDWLECAARCECPSFDDCPLFEEPGLPRS